MAGTSNEVLDRAAGALLGTAAGDALGAPYEFQPPRGPDEEVTLSGGGTFGWKAGEWTDDTSMAIVIAEVAAIGSDLLDESTQDTIVARWYHWADTATDVGMQTRAVLDSAGATGNITAKKALAESAALHTNTGRTAGNGSLMRTAPVALAYLNDEEGLVEAARAISKLTHWDPEAGDACVLWCCAIRDAVNTGHIDIVPGLRHIPVARRTAWASRLNAAEKLRPKDFRNNGWVVEALQGAWSAITAQPSSSGAVHFQRGVEAAVRGGNDTDTVAAIAGGLLGATYGASAVPADWVKLLHGWPGLRGTDLVSLGQQIAMPHSKGPL